MAYKKSTEIPKRLKPKDAVRRKLFLLSGNECAFPNCKNVLIDANGTMIGDVAHICAAEPDGPRFSQKMSNDERRSFDNLLLLCVSHHRQVDGKNSDVTVKELKKIKKKHEARFGAASGAIAKRFEEQFDDQTSATVQTLPRDLARYEKWLNDELNCELPDDADQIITDISKYVSSLKVVPHEHRNFVLALVERSDRRKEWSDGSVHLSCDDICSSLSIGHTKLKRLVAGLEEYGLGDFHELNDPYGREIPAVRLKDPADSMTWGEITDFCKAIDVELADFILDVQFGLLD